MTANETPNLPDHQPPVPDDMPTADERRVLEIRGRRRITFGVIWLVAGLLMTLITYANVASSEFGGTYFIFWGPVLYGIHLIYSGSKLLNKSRI
jgi:hypothetical protein